MIAGLSLRAVVLFVIVVIGQIGGSLLLANTQGFTRPGWSALCVLVYAVSFYALATLIKEGSPISMLMPLMAAVVPLATIALAVFLLGEPASWSRIALLGLSCLIVGLASTV